jgi:hypothetical protein
MEIEKNMSPVPVLSSALPSPGGTDKALNQMTGAAVMPLAMQKRAGRRSVMTNKAAVQADAAAAHARDPADMNKAIAFDVAQAGGMQEKSASSFGDPLRSATPAGIVGVADRASWLAMVAVPGTVLLRPPQLGKRPLIAASKPVTRAECERRCRQHGSCDPSDKAGCGGVLCGATDAMPREGGEGTN